MDDSYSEQEQWERVKKWIVENVLWILAGILIGIGGLSGWNWWQQRFETRAREASTQYELMLQAFDRGDRTRGLTLADQLRADYASLPYADQADLAAARALVETGELAKAAERLTKVMSSSKDAELKIVARLRLARVQLEQGNPDVAAQTLAQQSELGAFAPRIRELRGDIHYAKKEYPAALAEYVGARTADAEGLVDTTALDLKIADLLADGVEVPAVAAASGASAASGSTP